jgi:hypothetical protein
LLEHTLNSLSQEAVNFFKQMSHLTSSLAKTKGESPEKAGAGMASAKTNPSVSATFLMFIAVTSVLFFDMRTTLPVSRDKPNCGTQPSFVISVQALPGFWNFPLWLVLLARTGSPWI